MTYKPSMAEAHAMGLCYIARQKGLPNIVPLRAAVAQLHPLSCGWCEYPLDELIRILRAFNDDRRQFDDDRWNALPARAKGEAIILAQGQAAA